MHVIRMVLMSAHCHDLMARREDGWEQVRMYVYINVCSTYILNTAVIPRRCM